MKQYIKSNRILLILLALAVAVSAAVIAVRWRAEADRRSMASGNRSFMATRRTKTAPQMTRRMGGWLSAPPRRRLAVRRSCWARRRWALDDDKMIPPFSR